MKNDGFTTLEVVLPITQYRNHQSYFSSSRGGGRNSWRGGRARGHNYTLDNYNFASSENFSNNEN